MCEHSNLYSEMGSSARLMLAKNLRSIEVGQADFKRVITFVGQENPAPSM
jgi:hypothetical protein